MENVVQPKITKTVIDQVIKAMGIDGVFFENQVYLNASHICEAYCGASWNFYALSNGGFYMAPQSDKEFDCAVDGNGFSGKLEADAFGVVCSLFALNQMLWSVKNEKRLEKLCNFFEKLREFAYEHQDAGLIFRAID